MPFHPIFQKITQFSNIFHPIFPEISVGRRKDFSFTTRFRQPPPTNLKSYKEKISAKIHFQKVTKSLFLPRLPRMGADTAGIFTHPDARPELKIRNFDLEKFLGNLQGGPKKKEQV